MEEENKRHNKMMIYVLVGVVTLLVMVLGSAYAYFATGTTNNFGTTTITGAADSAGSVTLVGTNATIRLNLSGSDMMQGNDDITYWGTSTGDPSTTQNVVTIGSTSVSGSNYYNCNYTLSATATGTNNMYTAFQGMTGKSTEQIVLKVGDNTYDFNTASLFPITINGTLEGVSSSNIQNITAEFYLVNKSNLTQDTLQGTDLSITLTATNFSCTAVEEPIVPVVSYWTCNRNTGFFCDSTECDPVGGKSSTPLDDSPFYVEETRTGSYYSYKFCISGHSDNCFNADFDSLSSFENYYENTFGGSCSCDDYDCSCGNLFYSTANEWLYGSNWDVWVEMYLYVYEDGEDTAAKCDN